MSIQVRERRGMEEWEGGREGGDRTAPGSHVAARLVKKGNNRWLRCDSGAFSVSDLWIFSDHACMC